MCFGRKLLQVPFKSQVKWTSYGGAFTYSSPRRKVVPGFLRKATHVTHVTSWTGKSLAPFYGKEGDLSIEGSWSMENMDERSPGGTQKRTYCSPDLFPSCSSATSSCRTSPCSSHPASAVSHKCSEHLCSVNLEHFTTATHTCPQAGLTQGSQSQVERLAAGVQVRSPPALHEGVQTLTSMTCPGTKPTLPKGLSFQAEQNYPTPNPCPFARVW